MQNEGFNYCTHPNCQHQQHQLYTQKRFDVLNGFEFTLTRCLNCHKIVGLEIKKFSKD
jgi:hypothetical protein